MEPYQLTATGIAPRSSSVGYSALVRRSYGLNGSIGVGGDRCSTPKDEPLEQLPAVGCHGTKRRRSAVASPAGSCWRTGGIHPSRSGRVLRASGGQPDRKCGPGLWRQVRADLATGKGAELEKKFRAAYSSSALAVNAFAPLLDRVDLRDGLQVRGPAVRAGEIRIGTRIPANP